MLRYKNVQRLGNFFWEPTPSLIPQSCCLTPSNDTTICPKDLARIPYPGTPAKFIKVEHGCVDEINTQIKRHIGETYKFMWILTVFVIIGEISYGLVYFLRFYCSSGVYSRDNAQKINIMSAGDMGNDNEGITKFTVTQIGSSTEALPAEFRIDPDSGNPVVSFNIVSYDNNISKTQSGSSSISSAILPLQSAQPIVKPLPDLTSYNKANSQNRDNTFSGYDNSYPNTKDFPDFQYNKKNRNDGQDTANTTNITTTADVVSSGKPQSQRQAVFLVQDSTVSMDDITSGIGSNTSFDDFGDLPSQDVAQNRTKQKGAAGVTRKKRF